MTKSTFASDIKLMAKRSKTFRSARPSLRASNPCTKHFPGGKNIRGLQEETGATIEVDDDGRVYISSENADAVEAAKQYVEGMAAVPEVGKTYKGKVVKVMPNLGAFVEFMPGRDGLVHISQLAWKRVERVEDEVKEGDEIEVKVMELDSQGRVNLSRKALLPVPEGYDASKEAPYRRPERSGGDRGGRPPFRGGDRGRGPRR
jgi:polyribonucleotide nucleotidyltransferase